MKRFAGILGLLFLLVPWPAVSQSLEEAPLSTPLARWVFGPRVGVACVVAKPNDWNAAVQDVYAAARYYLPVYSQIGLSTEQRIALGDSRHSFVFHELLLIGGIDQNIVLPEVDLLLGIRFASGLSVGIGPNVSLRSADSDATPTVALMAGIGWTFRLADFNVPLELVIVPLPADWMPTGSILSGFDFAVLQ